jgi:hypothetical protein
LFSPENIPNIVLVLVGIGGIITAVATLRIIKKQTDATVIAAQAAKDSTNAIINSERARIFVKAIRNVSEHGTATFTIRAENYGRIPARINMYTYTEIALKNPDQDLPTPPKYGESLLSDDRLIEGGGNSDIMIFRPYSTANKERFLEVPGSIIVVFGIVEYLDGLSDEIKETRFAFEHLKEPFHLLGGQVRCCGPAEYNHWT